MISPCSTCHFYSTTATNGEDKGGTCRRSPPTVFMVVVPRQGSAVLANPTGAQQMQMEIKFPTAWPWVQPTHGCGEHKLMPPSREHFEKVLKGEA